MDSKFGVKINRYRVDNGRFSEQPFISEIYYSNHTITLCGVGSHHQNSIVEITITTLTLRARTLLLHAKRYCPELGERFPSTLTLPNSWGNDKGKYSPVIPPVITPGICILLSPRIITFTLNL